MPPHDREGRGTPGIAARRVFISYSSDDAAVATRIRERLEGSGIPCWMAPRDIEAGTSFPAAITAAIASCSALLLLLTTYSNNSPHVLREVELAFNARKPILPVRLTSEPPSANLHYFISTTQWFDVGPSLDDEELTKVETRLRSLAAGEGVGRDQSRGLASGEAAARDRSQGQGRRRAWIGGAAAVVMLVALGYMLVRETGPAREARPTGPAGPRPAWAWVPPGEFTMGCSAGDSTCEPDELPSHAVTIARGFWIATTEVTAAQYKRRVPAWSPTRDEGADAPAVEISWSEAKAYCAMVGGRLPTEAEWEYAARAGSASRYYGAPAAIAWYEANSGDRVHPVGQKAANAFGLHDMLGNVHEWVRDRYFNEYDDAGEQEIVEPLAPNAFATARGGAWTSQEKDVRVSNRFALPQDAAEPIVGFRCAADRQMP